jgi:hypothetical protein
MFAESLRRSGQRLPIPGRDVGSNALLHQPARNHGADAARAARYNGNLAAQIKEIFHVAILLLSTFQ